MPPASRTRREHAEAVRSERSGRVSLVFALPRTGAWGRCFAARGSIGDQTLRGWASGIPERRVDRDTEEKNLAIGLDRLGRLLAGSTHGGTTANESSLPGALGAASGEPTRPNANEDEARSQAAQGQSQVPRVDGALAARREVGSGSPCARDCEQARAVIRSRRAAQPRGEPVSPAGPRCDPDGRGALGEPRLDEASGLVVGLGSIQARAPTRDSQGVVSRHECATQQLALPVSTRSTGRVPRANGSGSPFSRLPRFTGVSSEPVEAPGMEDWFVEEEMISVEVDPRTPAAPGNPLNSLSSRVARGPPIPRTDLAAACGAGSASAPN